MTGFLDHLTETPQSDKRWYVIHTYSGYEKKVKTNLEHRIETMGMSRSAVANASLCRRKCSRAMCSWR